MERFKKTFLLLICLFGYIWRILASEILYGLYSNELISGQLVTPQRVDQNGKFLTHNLTHHHQKHYQHHRHRRSLIDDLEGQNKDPDYIHYSIKLTNETLHLELEPHTYFMAPDLIVERHKRDLRTRSTPMQNTNCHYHGKVRGHNNSRIAISTCDGLVGFIKTKNNEYFIEPSKEHNAHPTNGHPHVVFHRSSVKQKQEEQQQQQQNQHQHQKLNKPKRKKRKRKHHKQQHQRQQNQHQHHQMNRHRVPVSNCGTREPRYMETRLEWQPLGKVKIQGGRKVRRHQNHQHFGHRFQQQNQHRRQHHQQQHHNNQQHNHHRHDQHHHQTPAKYEYQTAGDASAPSTLLQHEASHDIPTIAASLANGIVGSSQRTKRSISSPRHVETLIVADTTMVSFHGDVKTYLLSIMNMVSSLYKDPSIGNSIEIVVVRIILLDEIDASQPHLNLTLNAQQNLDKFCSWQHKENMANKNDGRHHDVAILVTRKNICGENCMTLGLANVGGMCKPRQSCSLNEDNGIMLSHTIAHELGHNFGMFHDTAKIGCHPRIGPIVHIMTPTFGADTLQVSWSNCSRKFITHFLDQGFGECLDNTPTPRNKYNYPQLPPGVLFSAKSQCRLQFNITDNDVGVCSSIDEICTTLWCVVNGECVTNMRPTAPGTTCGENKWCQNGKCVHKEQLPRVNGGWGNWSEWSKCSRSCGGGVSIQQRECNNPVPENDGLFCIGERKRYKICKQQPCPIYEPSFRAHQCSNFDHVPYQGTYTYKWLPFFDKKDPCKLFCTDIDDTIIANWGDVVLDGTPCTLGTNNMCIDGICRKVGCDWLVDSDLQDDRCGICGGKGDQCKPIKEVFDELFNVTEGYVEIVTIPARARHIVIKELGNSPHFLAISKESGSPFYLNGDSLISMPGEFVIAGAESLYDRIDEQETINIPQPIEHSIAVYVIVRGSEPNDGIYYEFTLPAVNVSATDVYTWRLSDWTHCSTTCGGGLQYREALCYKNSKLIPTDEHCWSFAQNKRPMRLTRSCNEKQCPAHWWVGPWQFCPVTCKTANVPSPVKRRSVMCLDQNEVVVEDKKCKLKQRPSETEICEHLPECQTERSTAELFSSRDENMILDLNL